MPVTLRRFAAAAAAGLIACASAGCGQGDIAGIPTAPPLPPPAPPVCNPSFERDVVGWTAYRGTLERARVPDAPSGVTVAEVTATAGPSSTLDDSPASIGATASGGRYTARAWVRAVTTRGLGAQVALIVRERRPDGGLVDETHARSVLGPRFSALELPVVARRDDDTLDVRVSVTGLPVGASFAVDDVTLGPREGLTRGPCPVLEGALASAGGPFFAADSPVNRPLPPTLPVDPASATTVPLLLRSPVGLSVGRYTPALYFASASDPLVRVSLREDTRNGGEWGRNRLNGMSIRVPRDAAPSPETEEADNHMVVVSEGFAYSFYRASRPADGTLIADWGGIADLRDDGGNARDADGGRASGISQLAGLITVDEVRRGEIRHALAVVIDPQLVARSIVPPAIKSDGDQPDGPTTISEGQRLALPADIDESAVRSEDPRVQRLARMILVAMQRYGAIVVDRGGSGITFNAQNRVSFTSLGRDDPWPALIGAPEGSGSFSAPVRDTGIPWERLVVIPPGV